MTKADLINVIAEKANLQHKQAELVVNMVFDMMSDALKKDDRIEIRGFGSFVNRSYGSYQGRNPKTGQVVQVPPKRVPFFKVGKELKEMVDHHAGKIEEAASKTTTGPGA
ncbi:MAG: integration host factor subunit beta [Bdellovibrionales bacterium RIFOXYD1_FULL_44_7]|nr:MAG: integration host factor subunit beta [Bdellovibrionales bacterium RIFOXYD1_FULL_44_7]